MALYAVCLLSKEQKVEKCDATEDHSSTEADNITIN
jgi:hypothetical protein